jgi:DNA polymerase-1
MKAEIVGASIAWGAGEAAYLPVGHLYGKCLGRESFRNFIASILSNPEVKKLGQNLNYDLSILKRLGFDIDGIYFDTMLASYLINAESEHGLDAMATKYLGHRTIRYEDVVGKGKSQKNFSEINPNEARDYACEDADVAFRLFEIFKDAVLDDYAELFFGVEMPLMEVLVDMQLAGMKVDAGKLSLLDEDFSERIAALEKKIHEIAGESFNVASPKQLGTILFEKLRLPSAKKTKTGFSTSQDILEELALEHELPRFVIEYRSLSKLKSTYVDALRGLIDKKTGRIHTSFNQARTATGRLSSSEPNLQNIPAMTDEGRKIREAFVAEDGFCLVSADYSQIELRVLAHMSGDENLVDAFVRKLDVHAITASGIFGVNVEAVTREQRAAGKTVNFATIYGQGAYGLARQLSITPAEAGEYIENYFGKYPGVGKYRDEILSAARKNGYVETLFGRRRFFSDINSKNRQFSQMAERMAFNTVFQGTAADIIKMAMVKIHAGIHDISPNSRMLLQVHDELVFETPIDDADKVASFVKSAMEGAATLKIPLIVDIGRGTNWADAH